MVEASKHHEVFCSGKGATNIPDLPAEFNEYFGSMINMDDPRHARLRRIVSRAFSPRLIAKFEEDVRRVAASVVDDLLATGPCDFVANVAARLPLKIICDMMGIPGDQYDMVLANTNIILSGADPEFLSEDMDQAVLQLLGAGQALADLVTGLAAERAQAPREDLVSALVTANIDGEQLTSAELASFFILLVVAGNETTRTALSHALMLLTEFPDQRALLLADMDSRLEGAVEEIVRYASPVVFMRRTLTRDYTMNGQDYRKDDKVVLYYYSANRDEDLFPDPERFDITRSPNPHVGFGAAGPALLPRRPPGPPRAQGDAARTADPRSRYHRGRARPAAVQLHQRHQAPALRLQPAKPPDQVGQARRPDRLVGGVELGQRPPVPPRDPVRDVHVRHLAEPALADVDPGQEEPLVLPHDRARTSMTCRPLVHLGPDRHVRPAGLLGQLPPRPLGGNLPRRSARRPAWTSAARSAARRRTGTAAPGPPDRARSPARPAAAATPGNLTRSNDSHPSAPHPARRSGRTGRDSRLSHPACLGI